MYAASTQSQPEVYLSEESSVLSQFAVSGKSVASLTETRQIFSTDGIVSPCILDLESSPNLYFYRAMAMAMLFPPWQTESGWKVILDRRRLERNQGMTVTLYETCVI